MSQIYIPESAMAIAAHPDDIEYSCAGTLARWVQAGTRVCYVLCTSGEAGITEPGITREKACDIREKEARTAAEIAGANCGRGFSCAQLVGIVHEVRRQFLL